MGLILPWEFSPSISGPPTREKEGLYPHPRNQPDNLLSCRRVRNSKKYHKMFRKYCIRLIGTHHRRSPALCPISRYLSTVSIQIFFATWTSISRKSELVSRPMVIAMII